MQIDLGCISGATRGVSGVRLGILFLQGHRSADERKAAGSPEVLGMLGLERHILHELYHGLFALVGVLFNKVGHTWR